MQKRHHARWPWLAAFVSLAIVLTGVIATGASAGKSRVREPVREHRPLQRREADERARGARSSPPAGARQLAGRRTGRDLLVAGPLASSPDDYGGTDVNIITGGEGASPHVTQSEVQVWAQGNTVVAAFNDSRTAPSCYSGGSYSTNGGATWTHLNTRPFCTGHGTGYGDPVVYYDIEHSKWVAIFLASGCGGQGIGVWFSTDGITWTAGPCAHTGGSRRPRVGLGRQQPGQPLLRRPVPELEQLRGRRRRAARSPSRPTAASPGALPSSQRRLHPRRADHDRPQRLRLRRDDGRGRRRARLRART